MDQAPKPIKRSPQLAPLSREHHEGLLFAWKLKQGLSKGIAINRISTFIEWFWSQHLAAHFAKEEQALPLVLAHSHPLLQRMFAEHQTIRQLIEESKHGDLKKLEALMQSVNEHIRFEERVLFGEVEKAASPEQLDQLSMLLKDDVPTRFGRMNFGYVKKYLPACHNLEI